MMIMFETQLLYNYHYLLRAQKWPHEVEATDIDFRRRNKLERNQRKFDEVLSAHRQRVHGQGTSQRCEDVFRSIVGIGA